MELRERIGVDVGAKLSVSEAVSWAAENDVRYVDVRLGEPPTNWMDGDETERLYDVRTERDVHLGLHPSSSVNMAATEPFVSEAVDEYMSTYLRAADRLGAEWVIVHGGYHFTDDRKERIDASIARLKWMTERAADIGVDLLLENHNPEPAGSEIHYLPVTVDECRRYLDVFPSDRLRWAFTVNHAHMLPGGIDEFLDAFGLERCGEIRIADSNGEEEEHLQLGRGTIDFESLFSRCASEEYTGHYMLAFNDLEDMLMGRDWLIDVDMRA